MVKSVLGVGVDQLYDGAGKATAVQLKLTVLSLTASCDIGSVTMSGLTTSKMIHFTQHSFHIANLTPTLHITVHSI